jgi:hypothetical protein
MWFLSWIGLTPVAHCHYRQDVPPGGQIRKRLAFVIPHLGSGGAQRVAVNAANAFVERDIEIHIIINEDKNDYKLSPRVSLHVLTGISGQTLSSIPQLPGERRIKELVRRSRGPAFSLLHLEYCHMGSSEGLLADICSHPCCSLRGCSAEVALFGAS